MTSMNQLSMGGIVGAKRKVRTAILQRFVKMNIKAVKENYKKPNGMDLFHVTTYVTDQWSNKNFTKVYYSAFEFRLFRRKKTFLTTFPVFQIRCITQKLKPNESTAKKTPDLQ